MRLLRSPIFLIQYLFWLAGCFALTTFVQVSILDPVAERLLELRQAPPDAGLLELFLRLLKAIAIFFVTILYGIVYFLWKWRLLQFLAAYGFALLSHRFICWATLWLAPMVDRSARRPQPATEVLAMNTGRSRKPLAKASKGPPGRFSEEELRATAKNPLRAWILRAELERESALARLMVEQERIAAEGYGQRLEAARQQERFEDRENILNTDQAERENALRRAQLEQIQLLRQEISDLRQLESTLQNVQPPTHRSPKPKSLTEELDARLATDIEIENWRRRSIAAVSEQRKDPAERTRMLRIIEDLAAQARQKRLEE